MDRNTGKANHIEDYLITVRNGSWFGWTDSKNKIYANLIVHDGGYKPTEKECTDGLKALQDNFDATTYARKRQTAYPKLQEQLDLQYWDQVNGTTKWKEAIAKVKADNPKP